MDFRDRIRHVREMAERESRRKAEEQEREKLTREALAARYEEWARVLRETILDSFRDFCDEFDHFHIEEAFGPDGRIYAVYSTDLLADKDGMPGKFYSRLEFTVKRYDHSGQARLRLKTVVRNKERAKRSWTEDLQTGDVTNIVNFVREEILIFAQMYSSPDPEEEVHREYHL